MDAEFGLLQPWWLLLLLPLAIWLRRRPPLSWPAVDSPLAIRYPLLPHIRPATAGDGAGLAAASGSRVVALACVLFSVALAQPVRYTGKTVATADPEPVDMVIVAGTAISMTLQDYVVDGQRMDRMDMLRRLLDRFVAAYRGRRIGLVVLGNPPALWLPLTHDKTVLRDAVARLRTTLGGRLSDMGAALQLVSSGFPGGGDKVVVMVTDGSLQLGSTAPEAAARMLAAGGDTLYVIGIGASEPVDAAGVTGGLIYEPIDPAFLRRVARAGGGAFFHARDSAAFAAALATVEARHRQPRPGRPPRRLADPWYPLPLGLAMGLLFLFVARSLAPSARRRAAGP